MGSKRTVRVATLVVLWMVVASVGSTLAAPGGHHPGLHLRQRGQRQRLQRSSSLSADGTKVAFRSVATNLDPADTDTSRMCMSRTWLPAISPWCRPPTPA